MVLKEALSEMDLFKRPFLLNFENTPYNSSAFGKILSIAVFSYLIFSFFISDFWTRKNPFLFDQMSSSTLPPRLNIFHPLPIFLMTNNGEVVDDPSIFSLSMEHISPASLDSDSGEGNVKKIDRDLISCSKEDILNLGLDALRYVGAKCLVEKNNFIEGYWDENKLSYLRASLNRCQNVTSPGKCKSNEEIDEFFQDKKFGIIFPSFYLNMSDYDAPIKLKQKVEFEFTDPNMRKTSSIFMQKLKFSDDKSLMLADKKTTELIIFDTRIANPVHKYRSPIISEFFIHTSNNIQEKSREYQKFPSLLAHLGGQANALLIFGMLLTSLENTIGLSMKLMNQLYYFQGRGGNKGPEKNPCKANSSDNKASSQKDSHKRQIQKNISLFKRIFSAFSFSKKKKIFPANKKLSSSSVSSGGSLEKIPKSNIVGEAEGLKKSNHELKVGLVEYIKYKLHQLLGNRLSFKQKLLQKALERFAEEINIIYILRRLQDIEKLKLILLTPDQRLLFSCIERPSIFIDSYEQKHDKTNIRNRKSCDCHVKINFNKKNNCESTDCSQFGEIFQVYERVKNNPDPSENDRRLLQNIKI